MPVIADTAYLRLLAEPGPADLEAFTPEPAELAFARQRTRQPGLRLALLVLLKTFQHLGRITRLANVPTGIVHHIAASAGLASQTGELANYGDTTYRVRLAALVRGYMGVAAYDHAAPTSGRPRPRRTRSADGTESHWRLLSAWGREGLRFVRGFPPETSLPCSFEQTVR